MSFCGKEMIFLQIGVSSPRMSWLYKKASVYLYDGGIIRRLT